MSFRFSVLLQFRCSHSYLPPFVMKLHRCIVFGAGNYALLAAKINTRGARQCLIRHYPDSSHPMVMRAEFLDCNERWDLTPTLLERNISDLQEYKPNPDTKLPDGHYIDNMNLESDVLKRAQLDRRPSWKITGWQHNAMNRRRKQRHTRKQDP